MSSAVTFKVPSKKPRGRKTIHLERTGKVAWFQIGNRRVKFVLQMPHMIGAKEAEALTHYASGMIFGRLNDAKIRHMCASGHNAILTDRQAAEKLLTEKIALLGADKILAALDAADVINP